MTKKGGEYERERTCSASMDNGHQETKVVKSLQQTELQGEQVHRERRRNYRVKSSW